MLNNVAPDPLELRVVSGLHKGAALGLQSGQILIGSDPSCDIVLLDEGVLAHHLCLQFDGADWRIQPQGDLLPLGIAMPIGQASVVLCKRQSAWTAPIISATAEVTESSFLRSKKFILFALVGLLLLMLVGVWWGFSLTTPVTRAMPEKPGARPAIRITDDFSDPIQQRKLVTQLLSDRSLKDIVNLEFEADKISFKADLNTVEGKRLDEVVQILSQRLGSKINITTEIRPIELALPFEIREVILGPVSYLTLKTGATVAVGETVSGVRLVSIRPGILEFSGKRHFELPW